MAGEPQTEAGRALLDNPGGTREVQAWAIRAVEAEAVKPWREAMDAIVAAWELPANWDSAAGAMTYTTNVQTAIDKARALLESSRE